MFWIQTRPFNQKPPPPHLKMAPHLKMVRTMSFTLWTVIAEVLGSEKQTRSEFRWNPRPGAMRPAMHGRTKALGLHSCRALSSWPRENPAEKKEKWKGSFHHPVDKPHTRGLAVENPQDTAQSFCIAASITANNCPIVASVSSPMLETRKVVPLIFP
jgi:hypothetical protein